MELRKPELAQTEIYLYRRPLHPELFTIFLDKRIDTGRYETRMMLIGNGHLIAFHYGDFHLVELLTSRKDLLTEKGLLEEITVDRDQAYQVALDDRIYYLLHVQAERMSEAVFGSVHAEMTQFAQTRGIFMSFEQWASEGELPPFSFIDYERRPSELDIFTYHAFPGDRVMLRTQSVFSLEPIVPGQRPAGEDPFRKPL